MLEPESSFFFPFLIKNIKYLSQEKKIKTVVKLNS